MTVIAQYYGWREARTITLASGYREYREISRGHGRINDAHQLTDAAIDRSCYLTTIWHVCRLP